MKGKKATKTDVLVAAIIVPILLIFFYFAPRMTGLARAASYLGLLMFGGITGLIVNHIQKRVNKDRM